MQFRLRMLGMHQLATFLERWGSHERRARLRVTNFDPTFSSNNDIDVQKDIAWPRSKLDIN